MPISDVLAASTSQLFHQLWQGSGNVETKLALHSFLIVICQKKSIFCQQMRFYGRVDRDRWKAVAKESEQPIHSVI